MPPPRVLILRAPGTNCDLETAHAFERAGGGPTSIHVNRLMENPRTLDEFQILCLPGGFSYGDDLAAGRILGSQLRGHLAGPLSDFKAAGKLILGICNGFQILAKAGVLFDDTADEPIATLTWNNTGRFQDRWVDVRVASDKCVFFRGIESMYLPIAHAEGRFVPRDEATLEAMRSRGQLALVYRDNPNGAVADVAGACDATGRVLGLMPHPERHIDPTQHPRWTRGDAGEVGDGLRVFQNAVEYFR